jgi:hypothetical protein
MCKCVNGAKLKVREFEEGLLKFDDEKGELARNTGQKYSLKAILPSALPQPIEQKILMFF